MRNMNLTLKNNFILNVSIFVKIWGSFSKKSVKKGSLLNYPNISLSTMNLLVFKKVITSCKFPAIAHVCQCILHTFEQYWCL